jgi:hypothetical protein
MQVFSHEAQAHIRVAEDSTDEIIKQLGGLFKGISPEKPRCCLWFIARHGAGTVNYLIGTAHERGCPRWRGGSLCAVENARVT